MLAAPLWFRLGESRAGVPPARAERSEAEERLALTRSPGRRDARPTLRRRFMLPTLEVEASHEAERGQRSTSKVEQLREKAVCATVGFSKAPGLAGVQQPQFQFICPNSSAFTGINGGVSGKAGELGQTNLEFQTYVVIRKSFPRKPRRYRGGACHVASRSRCKRDQVTMVSKPSGDQAK